MVQKSSKYHLHSILRRLPDAAAVVQGGPDNRTIDGVVEFYQEGRGVWVVADLAGLPVSAQTCGNRFFAFHIHGGSQCTGTREAPFAGAGTHYDPGNCPHPGHAGDLPPLISAGGRAFLVFLTDRFTVREVIGKTVIVHDRPDDFTTQPSGNAGNRIACGVISRIPR